MGKTEGQKLEEKLFFKPKHIAKDNPKDIEKAMENFSMEECQKADLYPDIWDYLDEEEEIKDDIRTCFVKMKNFYKKILTLKGNVLVTIC